MGVQTMNKPSKDKATITSTIDKSKLPSAAPTKPGTDELSEQELDKASGGAFDTYILLQGEKNIPPVRAPSVSEIVVTKVK
jgi:hypothetical protein